MRELLDDPTTLKGTGVWETLKLLTGGFVCEDSLTRAFYQMSHVQWGAFMMAMGYRRSYGDIDRRVVAENLYGCEDLAMDMPKVLRALAFAMEQVADAEDFREEMDARAWEEGDEEHPCCSAGPSYREDFHADG